MTPIQAMEDNQRRHPQNGRRQCRNRHPRLHRPVFDSEPDHFSNSRQLQHDSNTAAVPTIIGVGATFVVLMGRIDLSVEGTMGAAVSPGLSPNSRTSADWDLARSSSPLRSARARTARLCLHTRLKVLLHRFARHVVCWSWDRRGPVRPRDAAVSFRSGCPLVAHIGCACFR